MKTMPGPCTPDDTKRLLRRHLQVISLEMRQRDTDDALFHGCWDWHSAVHGHLAMFLGSQALGWKAQVDWLVHRLDSQALDQSLERLIFEPDFERPYGRAWLLHLMAELERHAASASRRQVLDAIAHDLTNWVETHNLGAGTDYEEPCFVVGALVAWSAYLGAKDLLRRLGDKIESEVASNPADLEADCEAPGPFFSRWAMQALAIQRGLGNARLKAWLTAHDMKPKAPIEKLHSVHHMGIHASRAWGLWAAYQATGEAPWQDEALAHIEAADALHEQWLSDRHAYSHWLPQFTVFAVLGALNAPRSQ